jgi:hypothetical protein
LAAGFPLRLAKKSRIEQRFGQFMRRTAQNPADLANAAAMTNCSEAADST